MELKKYRLGDCLELQRDYDLTSSQMLKGEIAVVGSNGIIGYHAPRGNTPCITVGRSGSVGKVHYYECPTWAHNTALFVKDFKGNEPKYLYYFLKNLHLSSTPTAAFGMKSMTSRLPCSRLEQTSVYNLVFVNSFISLSILVLTSLMRHPKPPEKIM